jgi:ornithine cyclodeaminase/alanine dehydrogenase-like protein (mu-crystallin family)
MPTRRELGEDIFQSSKVFVDSIEQACKESGDLISALSVNYRKEQNLGEVGEVAAGKRKGRTTSDEITLFKSVGIAVEDVIAAQTVFMSAQRKNLGTNLKL